MDDCRPPEPRVTLEEQVRALGFDPRHLTLQEQEELVEFYRLCPDEPVYA